MIQSRERFLSPFLFNRLRYGGGLRATIESRDGSPYAVPIIDGDPRPQSAVRLEDDAPIGLTGEIRIDRQGFVFWTAEEVAAEQQRLEDQREAASLERERIAKIEAEQREQRRITATEFNRSLGIPVEWGLGRKIVLSGLLANSDGTGMNRRSVYHVFLKQPLDIGRLHRRANSYLCADKAHFGQLEYGGEPDAIDAGYRVSCKRCIDMAHRIQMKVGAPRL